MKVQTNTLSNTTSQVAIFCIDEKAGLGKTLILLGSDPLGEFPALNETEFDWLMDSFHILAGRAWLLRETFVDV